MPYYHLSLHIFTEWKAELQIIIAALLQSKEINFQNNGQHTLKIDFHIIDNKNIQCSK